MFLYACGVSRVHQEFELFEQTLTVVIILKREVLSIPILMIQAKVTGVFSPALLPQFPPPPPPPPSRLLFSVVKTR